MTSNVVLVNLVLGSMFLLGDVAPSGCCNNAEPIDYSEWDIGAEDAAADGSGADADLDAASSDAEGSGEGSGNGSGDGA